MSDLQALVPEAIDVVTEWRLSEPEPPLPLEVIGALLALTDAARKYANGTPTYLVYTRQDDVGYLGHIYQGLEASRMSANPNLPGKWFTALGVTEA